MTDPAAKLLEALKSFVDSPCPDCGWEDCDWDRSDRLERLAEIFEADNA